SDLLQRLDQVLALVARAVRVGVVHRRAELRSEHDLVALAAQQRAERLLAVAVGVLVGRVQEVAAAVKVLAENPVALRLVAPPFGVAERRRAEAEPRHPQPAAPQDPKFHQPWSDSGRNFKIVMPEFLSDT